MLYKLFASVVSATILSATLAGAQSLALMGGPSNLPPAGFTGQQFVDSRGCVFLRAGFGGQVNWVPRVNRSHRPLCGFPPTFGAAVAAAVQASMAPDPLAAAAPVAAPMVVTPVVAPPVAAPVLAPAPRLAAPVAVAPVVVAAPQPAPRRGGFWASLFGPARVAEPTRLFPPVAEAVPVIATPAAPVQPRYATAAPSGQAGCFAQAPHLETVVLRSGGTALVCTRGDGTLTGWMSPVYGRGAAPGAALNGQTPAVAPHAPAITTAIPTPPRGYKLAWTDDRLNPLRGQGTAQGQARQDQVWTRDIPAVQVVQHAAPARAAVTLSTMSAPQHPPAARAATYVQVGTFGQPANAAGVKARLSALGLPVSTSQITRKGKPLQIVFAGPFGTPAQAQAALATARGAGFADAILK